MKQNVFKPTGPYWTMVYICFSRSPEMFLRNVCPKIQTIHIFFLIIHTTTHENAAHTQRSSFSPTPVVNVDAVQNLIFFNVLAMIISTTCYLAALKKGTSRNGKEYH